MRVLLLGVLLLLTGQPVFSLDASAFAPAKEEATAQTSFSTLADAYLADMFKDGPTGATEAGIHDYDDRLEDYSKKKIDERIALLKKHLIQFEKIDVGALDQSSKLDHALVLYDIRSSLHALENVQMWRKNPDRYSSGVTSSIFSLMKRNFAPQEVRLKSVVARERQIPAALSAARTNLENPPAIYTKVALEQMPGIIKFFKTSVPQAFTEVKDPALLAEFKSANDKAIDELLAYQKYLQEDLLPRSKGNFAIGPENYRKKLLYDEGVSESLEELTKEGYRELRRLQNKFEETAKAIDPKRTPLQLYADISKNHPKPDQLIASTTAVLEKIRKFCVEKPIVTIPSEDRATVDETPPFMRALSFASMDTPGPFETKAKEAYYHVTLPETGWSPEKAEEHMRAFNHLEVLNTSVHEAYPGHYVQFLWVKKAPSKIRKVLGCGSNAEGWAHYCEEMMLDEGFGDGDKQLRLAQIHAALWRVCRYLVGIQMHTGGMTMDQGIQFFMKEGYQEKANAERETKRGAMDPTYLVYTLGKLRILALRADYQKLKGPNFDLREFHDRFLAQGYPQLDLVRTALLGEDKSSAAARPASAH